MGGGGASAVLRPTYGVAESVRAYGNESAGRCRRPHRPTGTPPSSPFPSSTPPPPPRHPPGAPSLHGSIDAAPGGGAGTEALLPGPRAGSTVGRRGSRRRRRCAAWWLPTAPARPPPDSPFAPPPPTPSFGRGHPAALAPVPSCPPKVQQRLGFVCRRSVGRPRSVFGVEVDVVDCAAPCGGGQGMSAVPWGRVLPAVGRD